MANIANVLTQTPVVGYHANLDPIPCIIDTGPFTTHEMGAVIFRQPIAQPTQGGGDANPLGPQRWPI